MRTLNIIPIVHTPEDLGSLASQIENVKSRTFTPVSNRTGTSFSQWFWEELRLGIEAWPFEAKSLQLYQDALPFTGSTGAQIERKIVDDLARQGHPNYVLLQSLVERGAELVGTESPQLLMAEYNALKKALSDGTIGVKNASANETSDILEQRDRFIADRIQSTLRANTIGLLFIGMMHRVESFLPTDIQVQFPFGRPQLQSSQATDGLEPIVAVPAGTMDIDTQGA